MRKQHDCAHREYRDGFKLPDGTIYPGHFHDCGASATYECEEKWYCWQHNPGRKKRPTAKEEAMAANNLLDIASKVALAVCIKSSDKNNEYYTELFAELVLSHHEYLKIRGIRYIEYDNYGKKRTDEEITKIYKINMERNSIKLKS